MPQPSKIPLAFAASGDKNIIPESTETTGLASWREGFPAITSAPFSEGGIAPKRADFNGIFNALSQSVIWLQQGGVYAYDVNTDYEAGNVVLDAGGLYVANAGNGPSSAVVQPSSDTTGATWKLVRLDLATQIAAGYMSAADKTKLDGLISTDATQSAAGYMSAADKTRLDSVILTNATPTAAGYMSAADKMAVDKSFRGIKVGDSILYPSGEHQYAELVPESPVILTPDPATGKITVAVDASITAKPGAVPVADTAAKLGPSWGVIPVGGIVWLALDTVPDGFLLCDGALVSRSSYSRLFAVIGTKWGAGNGSTTFALPDMRNRVPWGASAAGSYISAGLPNITGVFRSVDLGASEEAIGAFRETMSINTGLTRDPSSSSMDFDKAIEFEASLSNTIYGASNTVQPPAATLLPLIKY